MQGPANPADPWVGAVLRPRAAERAWGSTPPTVCSPYKPNNRCRATPNRLFPAARRITIVKIGEGGSIYVLRVL